LRGEKWVISRGKTFWEGKRRKSGHDLHKMGLYGIPRGKIAYVYRGIPRTVDRVIAKGEGWVRVPIGSRSWRKGGLGERKGFSPKKSI